MRTKNIKNNFKYENPVVFSRTIQAMKMPGSAKKVFQEFFRGSLTGLNLFSNTGLAERLSMNYRSVQRAIVHLREKGLCRFEKMGHKFRAMILVNVDSEAVYKVEADIMNIPKATDAQKIHLALSLEQNKYSGGSQYLYGGKPVRLIGYETSMEQIAEENGISGRTAQRMVRDLSRRELLLIETVFSGDRYNRRQKKNLYMVNIKNVFCEQFAMGMKFLLCEERYGFGNGGKGLFHSTGDEILDVFILREIFIWNKKRLTRWRYYNVRSFESVYNHKQRKVDFIEDHERHMAFVEEAEEGLEFWRMAA